MREIVLAISNIEEYGKLVSYCIEKDINVWRTYWDERRKGDRCYHINWVKKSCYYASRSFYEQEGYEILKPIFVLDEYGRYQIDWSDSDE